MKKIFAIVLCICTVLAVVACTPAATEAEYKLGMGIVVDMGSSATTNAQVDATVATVVTDADGKIVACRIDVAQNKMNVTDGAVDTAATFKSKMEKGAEYGMSTSPYSSDNDNDGRVLEWDAQAKAFEAFVVGKTVAEVKALKGNTQFVNNHTISADADLLAAGCTIEIGDFCEAVVKACEDAQGMSFKAVAGTFTLGVSVDSYATDSVAATEEKDGTVAMYSDFAAAVVVDGKIVAALNDAIQPKITVTIDGDVEPQEFKGTKRELKEGYGMAGSPYSSDNNEDGQILEWYVQSYEFSKYVVGKTAAEVAGMETQNVHNHNISTDEALLAAGCTIQIPAICAVVAEAVNNAR